MAARTTRKGCRDCGGEKPPGPGQVYCTACTERKATELEAIKRQPTPTRSEEARAYDRERRRRERQDPEKRERLRRATQEWRARQSKSEEGRRHRNARQLAYHHANRERLNEQKRLLRERRIAAAKGLKLLHAVPEPPDRRQQLRQQKDIERAPLRWRLPAVQLTRMIRRAAEMAEPDGLDVGGMETNALERVCEHLGIPTRVVWSWSHGERPLMDFYRALDILDGLDLNWWEVWTERTVRRPILTVTVRGTKVARGRALCRTTWKRLPYGDMHDVDGEGHDADTLAFVEGLLEATDDEEMEKAVDTYAEQRAAARLSYVIPALYAEALRVSGGLWPTAPVREDVAA